VAVQSSATTAVCVVNEMDQNKKTKRTLTVRNDVVATLCGMESLEALQAHPILWATAYLSLADKPSRQETMEDFVNAL
jgi:hypothetical protein